MSAHGASILFPVGGMIPNGVSSGPVCVCNLTGESQLMSAQSEVVARGQHHVSVLGEVCDELCQMSECIVRELMGVIDYYDDRIVVLVQLC